MQVHIAINKDQSAYVEAFGVFVNTKEKKADLMISPVHVINLTFDEVSIQDDKIAFICPKGTEKLNISVNPFPQLDLIQQELLKQKSMRLVQG